MAQGIVNNGYHIHDERYYTESEIDTKVSELNSSISSEVSARQTADTELQNKINLLTNYVTPEMFGAVGDGVTDDTNAFLTALSTGRIVFLESRYNITTLSLDNYCSIIGDNAEIIINYKIIFNAGAEIMGVKFKYKTGDVPLIVKSIAFISNCEFDGENQNKYINSLLELKNVNCGNVEYCNFSDNYYGRNFITTGHCNNINICFCNFDHCGSSAISITEGNDNIKISNNYVKDCCINTSFDDGMISTYGDFENGVKDSNIVIDNNYLKSTIAPYYCAIRLDGVKHTKVTNNIIDFIDILPSQKIGVFVQDRADHEIKVRNEDIIIRCNKIYSCSIGIDIGQNESDAFLLDISGNVVDFSSRTFSCYFVQNRGTKYSEKSKIVLKENVVHTPDMSTTYKTYAFLSNNQYGGALIIDSNHFQISGGLLVSLKILGAITNNIIEVASDDAISVYGSAKNIIYGNVIFSYLRMPVISVNGGTSMVNVNDNNKCLYLG